MDVREFNVWFDVLNWGKSEDEMVEFLFHEILKKTVPSKNTGKIVLSTEIIDLFKNTYENNKKLLELNYIHPKLKEFGTIHQSMIGKLLLKIRSIN